MKELLFPRRCPVCDRPVLRTLARPDALICPACERQLVRARGAVCGKCGKLLDAKNTAATAGQTDASGAWKQARQAANALSEGTKPAAGMKPAARGMQAVRLCGDCATIRHAFSRGGAASDNPSRSPFPEVSGTAASSTIVFQAPHPGHFPIHFADSAPQDWQT